MDFECLRWRVFSLFGAVGVCFSKHALSVLLARPEAAGVSSLACGDAPASPRSLHQLSGASFWAIGVRRDFPTK